MSGLGANGVSTNCTSVLPEYKVFDGQRILKGRPSGNLKLVHSKTEAKLKLIKE